MVEFKDVSRSALVGTVATALIQGALAAAGYALAGVSTPVTWGLVTAISSLLPVVGTFLVWVPVAAYELLHGRIGAGLFVLAWGFFVVSLATDYIIRPRLMGRKGRGHPLLMLVSIIGGIGVMGPAGLIAAPIVMSLFLAVLRIYEAEAAEASDALKPSAPRAASVSTGAGHPAGRRRSLAHRDSEGFGGRPRGRRR
jgi:predicted PurR-regulated permease PerM